jgi:hypothetical protein
MDRVTRSFAFHCNLQIAASARAMCLKEWVIDLSYNLVNFSYLHFAKGENDNKQL